MASSISRFIELAKSRLDEMDGAVASYDDIFFGCLDVRERIQTCGRPLLIPQVACVRHCQCRGVLCHKYLTDRQYLVGFDFLVTKERSPSDVEEMPLPLIEDFYANVALVTRGRLSVQIELDGPVSYSELVKDRTGSHDLTSTDPRTTF